MTAGKAKQTYVALLRGINVSGKNVMRMPALKASFSALGFNDVTTYLQSGNVVFNVATTTDETKLAEAIQSRIVQDFGHEVPVLVMAAKTLDVIASSNPLLPHTSADEKQFHATFLFKPVTSASFDALKLPAVAGERAMLLGKVVLLHCPHGYGNTRLSNSYFERALGVPATTRNWRTVLALQSLCGSDTACGSD